MMKKFFQWYSDLRRKPNLSSDNKLPERGGDGESLALERPPKEQTADPKSPCLIFSFDQQGKTQPLTDKEGNPIIPTHEQWERAMTKFLASGYALKRVEYSTPLNPEKGLIIYTFKPGELKLFMGFLVAAMSPGNEASFTVENTPNAPSL